jgi:hypothetical protein
MDITKHNKYLDNTVIGLTIITFLILLIIGVFWFYYIPYVEKKAIRINFLDTRDPPNINPPSSTEQDIANRSLNN